MPVKVLTKLVRKSKKVKKNVAGKKPKKGKAKDKNKNDPEDETEIENEEEFIEEDSETEDDEVEVQQTELRKIAMFLNSLIDPIFITAFLGLAVWGLSLALISYETGNHKLAAVQCTCCLGGIVHLAQKKETVEEVMDEADDILDVDTEEELTKEINDLIEVWFLNAADAVSIFFVTSTVPVWITLPVIVAKLVGIKVWIMETIFAVFIAPMLVFCAGLYESMRDWSLEKLIVLMQPIVERLVDEVEEHTIIL